MVKKLSLKTMRPKWSKIGQLIDNLFWYKILKKLVIENYESKRVKIFQNNFDHNLTVFYYHKFAHKHGQKMVKLF